MQAYLSRAGITRSAMQCYCQRKGLWFRAAFSPQDCLAITTNRKESVQRSASFALNMQKCRRRKQNTVHRRSKFKPSVNDSSPQASAPDVWFLHMKVLSQHFSSFSHLHLSSPTSHRAPFSCPARLSLDQDRRFKYALRHLADGQQLTRSVHHKIPYHRCRRKDERMCCAGLHKVLAGAAHFPRHVSKEFRRTKPQQSRNTIQATTLCAEIPSIAHGCPAIPSYYIPLLERLEDAPLDGEQLRRTSFQTMDRKRPVLPGEDLSGGRSGRAQLILMGLSTLPLPLALSAHHYLGLPRGWCSSNQSCPCCCWRCDLLFGIKRGKHETAAAGETSGDVLFIS